MSKLTNWGLLLIIIGSLYTSERDHAILRETIQMQDRLIITMGEELRRIDSMLQPATSVYAHYQTPDFNVRALPLEMPTVPWYPPVFDDYYTDHYYEYTEGYENP